LKEGINKMNLSRIFLQQFVVICALLLSLPALATELQVTYSSAGGYCYPEGYYSSFFGNDVLIGYSITGNTSPVASVQVMVENQEDEWTCLGSSVSGYYDFTPAYFTSFVPYFLVFFEDHTIGLFYADNYLLSWANEEQYNEFEGESISPAVMPGDPYYNNPTHTCSVLMCTHGECLLHYIEVLNGHPCSEFPDNCQTDDDC
jgi:hypothetical protein